MSYLSFSDTAGFIGIDTSSGNKALQLPPVSDRNGRVITFKDKTGNANSHPITIYVDSGDRFEGGASSYTINVNYGALTIIARSPNKWYFIQKPQYIPPPAPDADTLRASTLFVPLQVGDTVLESNTTFSFLQSTQGTYFGGVPNDYYVSTTGPSISSQQIFIADVNTGPYGIGGAGDTNTLTIEQTPTKLSDPLLFNFTGGDQTFVVPPHVYKLYVTLAGAGGGDAWSNDDGFGVVSSSGGRGGLVKGWLAVLPGDVINVAVGQAGVSLGTSGYGQGGTGGYDWPWQWLGSGGGYSFVYNIRTTSKAFAGGGGGATLTFSGITGFKPTGGIGGDGGGLVGEAGASGGPNNAVGGPGGTQLAAGGNGDEHKGGDSIFIIGVDNRLIGGGAGGGGYYGGGSGDTVNVDPAAYGYGGGGGGSSFIDELIDGSTVTGGGAANNENGYVIIQWYEPNRTGNYIEVRDGISKFLLDRGMNVGINVLSNALGYQLTVGGSTLTSSITAASLLLVDQTNNIDNNVLVSDGRLLINGNEINASGYIYSITGVSPIAVDDNGGHNSISFLPTYGINLARNYGYISTYSNVVYMSTAQSITSSFSGNFADARTLITIDL
jgi:hypothetical protein